MTHTDASEESCLLMEQFSNIPLIESVEMCIGNKYQCDNLDKIESLYQHINNACKQSLKPYYLEESTTTQKLDPMANVTKQLHHGWKTGGGFTLSITEPPKWGEYLSHSRNVRYKIHSWIMLDSLLRADEVSETDEYLDYAVHIAENWILKYVINREKDEFAWYDMATGQRATKLSYMLRRLISTGRDKTQIFHFILAAQIHFIELLNEDRIATHSNHGLFQMAGLLSLGENLDWMIHAPEAKNFSRGMIKKMLEMHFAEDGLHLEHSPDYHLWMINHLQSLKQSGWLTGETPSIQDLVKSLEEAANWMVTTNKNVIPIGDTANNVHVTKRWRDYNGKFNLGTKLFPIGGLLINNSSIGKQHSQLVFSAQFHSRQHKHADHLNVLYSHGDRPLLVDSGTFTYQYDIPERMYCESTRGHNTVEIDGLNYSRFRQDVFGSAISLCVKAGPCVIVEGIVHHKRLIPDSIPNNNIKSTDAIFVDVKHRRLVIEFPGSFLAIIDEITSAEEHDYISWYHFNNKYILKKDTATKLAAIDENGEKICQIQCYDSHSNSVDYRLVKGQSRPTMQGWFSHNGRELIENTALGYIRKSSNDFIVTLFDFKMEKSSKPYLRRGTNGKYVRFSFTQQEKKFDFKIILNNENQRDIIVEIDSVPNDVVIIYDEG